MWAICSWLLISSERCERCTGRSPKMSNRERIAQVAHKKWANERIAHFFERIAHLLILEQKTSDSLGKLMNEFPALVHIQTISFNILMFKYWCQFFDNNLRCIRIPIFYLGSCQIIRIQIYPTQSETACRKSFFAQLGQEPLIYCSRYSWKRKWQ